MGTSLAEKLVDCAKAIDIMLMKEILAANEIHLTEFSVAINFVQDHTCFNDIIEQSPGPASFRLTSAGPLLSVDADHTQQTLDNLHEAAKKFDIDFEVRRLAANGAADTVDYVLKLTRASEDETAVVRREFQLHKSLTLAGAIEKVLSKLKELKLEIQDFLECFCMSFLYYSIVFDSLYKDNLEAIINANRCKVLWDMFFFRSQICNILAQGGTDQIERHA
ncbi:DELLA protein 2-like [Populus alba]|uniref:DELLA protein 2-like n=1 Tax=Populus alba TaxID=43335 RepID=UPI0015887A74|nr:DELLA protein GAIP-like [Populus alba]